MPGVAINHLTRGLEANDCAVVALHCYLGVTYADVMRLAVYHDAKAGRQGLWMRTICAMARELGHPLKRRKLTPASYGIIHVNGNGVNGHAAVVRRCLVMDRDEVLEVEHWLRKHRHRGRVWVLTAEDDA
jgi:hypothetical protein